MADSKDSNGSGRRDQSVAAQRAVATGPRTASPADRPAKGAVTSAAGVDVGVLNRHWYRRSLNRLETDLRSIGATPNVDELRTLCDNVVMGFLNATMGQAPDTEQPQYSADRAYYLPFEGDRLKEFRSAKSYYQLANPPESLESERGSLWSFLPWRKNADTIARPSIDKVRSVHDGVTISLDELLRGEREPHGYGARPVAVKALLTNDGDLDAVEESLKANDRAALERAAYELFAVYRALPGDADAEFLLLCHMHLLRWLGLGGSTTAVSKDGVSRENDVSLSQQASDMTRLKKTLIPAIVRIHFAGPQADAPEPGSALHKLIGYVNRAIDVVAEHVGESQPARPETDPVDNDDVDRVLEELVTDFSESNFAEKAVDSESSRLSEYEIFTSHLASFAEYFLVAGLEKRIEDDLDSRSADDTHRAGRVDESFVWICGDFEDTADSLRRSSDASDRSVPEGIDRAIARVNEPYKRFFRQLEVRQLRRREPALKDYWRVRGAATRRERVFTSFTADDGVGSEAGTAAASVNGAEGVEADTGTRRGLARVVGNREHLDPRPQNVFLRVKITDSLNEPVINGMFVVTADFDDKNYRGKTPKDRLESVQDLLAFARVYFFIVRDHLLGLDRARRAMDVGLVNQHLFDKRLTSLQSVMADRMGTEPFVALGPLHPKNWPLFSYEVLNEYAAALIDKRSDVVMETFPFDRLMFFPLRRHGDEDSPYSLPFFLFQSIVAEVYQGKVQGDYYSLMRPFLSPVEVTDARSKHSAFSARSYQQAYVVDGRTHELPLYLDKHFLGTVPLNGLDEGSPRTHTVKSSEKGSGSHWAIDAIESFCQTGQIDSWLDFLVRLTETAEAILFPDRRPLGAGAALEFAMGFSLLSEAWRRATADFSDELKVKYDEEHRVRFRQDERLHLLAMVDGDAASADVEKLFERVRSSTEFESLSLQGDSLLLRFLEHLSTRVRNKCEAGADGTPTTWFQPVLTRPHGESADDTVMRASKSIAARYPRYDEVWAHRDSIELFLGYARVGDLEGNQSSGTEGIIAMIRDFDDRETCVDEDERDRELFEKIDSARRDLGLFTTTFFSNVDRFLAISLERQQARELTTDVAQIARNWYSSGSDRITARIQDELDRISVGDSSSRLTTLRPEIMDALFVEMVDVLGRPGTSQDDHEIQLESFPFDRVFHVPILLEGPAGRFGYARTCGRETEDDYDEVVRQGRNKTLGGNQKVVAGGRPIHGLAGPDTAGRAAVWQRIEALMHELARPETGVLGRFERRLYQADSIQSLTISGIVTLFIDAMRGHESSKELKALRERMQLVMKTCQGALERTLEDESTHVTTRVFMDRLATIGKQHLDGHAKVREEFRTGERHLPYFWELFEACEGEQSRFEYGLDGSSSKVFYVYYSLAAPNGFLDDFSFDFRYRGVFCFVLDQARTDPKSTTFGEISVAELGQQDDIRTFVHSVVGALRLLLREQDLRSQLLRPGVDEFINGMLHRLKNDLSVPIATMQELEGRLGRPAEMTSVAETLLSKVDNARSTMEGIGTLFQDLKRLSEIESASIRLETFTSTWLGWLFVEKVANALKKEIDSDPALREAYATLDDDPFATAISEAERMRRADDSGAVLGPQRQLIHLQAAAEAVLRIANRNDCPLTFSYVVTARKTVSFKGSYLLEEALTILTENAVQAMWDHVRKRSGDVLPFVGLTVRPGEDEVRLEFDNSTTGIAPEILNTLNDEERPRPISTQQHRRSSGKKGGSGFGHYFARRIVRDYCGAREHRRKLDIHVEAQPGGTTCAVIVTLLPLKVAEPVNVTGDDMRAAVDAICRPNGIATRFDHLDSASEVTLPGDLSLKQVLATSLDLQMAARDKLEEQVAWARQGILGDVSWGVERLRESLEKLLSTFHADSQESNEVASALLMSLRRIPKESFVSFSAWFKEAGRQRASDLDLIFEGARWQEVRRWMVDGGPTWTDMLEDDEIETAEDEFGPLRPHLRDQAGESVEGGTLGLLGVGVNRGSPVPHGAPARMLVKPLVIACHAYDLNGGVAIELRAYDTDEDGATVASYCESELEMRAFDPKSIEEQYAEGHVGEAFTQLQSALGEFGSLTFGEVEDASSPCRIVRIRLERTPRMEEEGSDER